MTHLTLGRREFLQAAVASGASCLASGACASEPSAEGLKEPVHRLAKANNTNPPPGVPDKHPLDPALDVARKALVNIQTTVTDYTCRIWKQERINGELGDLEQMDAKVRNRKIVNGKVDQPLSVYLRFVSPKKVEGREVVWVEGKNNGKLRAHEGGVKGRFLPSVWLDPDGSLAMNGQLHPIYDIGIENLVLKLIERGEREKKFGAPNECEVEFRPGAKINGRPCTLLLVTHPIKRPHFEFYRAEILIDDALQIPLRYAAYLWPTKPGSEDPKDWPVIEQYTYTNVKLNVGLTPEDFDSNNQNYNF